MTIVPMFLLTLGAINWGYVYPLVFLFTALLRQRVLGKEICFNFLYVSTSTKSFMRFVISLIEIGVAEKENFFLL